LSPEGGGVLRVRPACLGACAGGRRSCRFLLRRWRGLRRIALSLSGWRGRDLAAWQSVRGSAIAEPVHCGQLPSERRRHVEQGVQHAGTQPDHVGFPAINASVSSGEYTDAECAAPAPCPPHTRRRCGPDGQARGYSGNALATACVAPRLDGLQDEEDEAQEGSRGLVRRPRRGCRRRRMPPGGSGRRPWRPQRIATEGPCLCRSAAGPRRRSARRRPY
jgi:hypothetical protein